MRNIGDLLYSLSAIASRASKASVRVASFMYYLDSRPLCIDSLQQGSYQD